MEKSPFTPSIIFWMVINLGLVTGCYYLFGFYMGTVTIITVLGICGVGNRCRQDQYLDDCNPIMSPIYSDNPDNIFHIKTD